MHPENQGEKPRSIEVPREKLSEEILDALIEEFVLREGTDYGAIEISLEKKKEQVLKQLIKEEIKIVFDFESNSATLMSAIEYKKKALI